MRITSIATTRKNKQFSFSPRYYNQDKEEFKARYAEIEARVTGTTDNKGAGTVMDLKEKWRSGQKMQHFEKKSSLRLVVIIAILLAISYWLLYS